MHLFGQIKKNTNGKLTETESRADVWKNKMLELRKTPFPYSFHITLLMSEDCWYFKNIVDV